MITKALETRSIGGVLLGLIVITTTSPARAQLGVMRTCSQLALAASPTATSDGGPPPGFLVVAGPDATLGSATAPALATALTIALESVPVVYVTTPSCAAISDLLGGQSAGATGNLIDTGGTLEPCIASGMVPDVALSEVYPDTCAPGLLTAAHIDILGPINVSTLVVPFASTEASVSADAVYVIFGFGAVGYAVKPWTDPGSIFAPETSSSGLMLLASAVGLAPAKWANPQVVNTAVAAETKAVSGGKANAAIGILPAVSAEANPLSLKVLAYQHTGQGCGYLPDSDNVHADRINVRQGRYALWGPTHFIMGVDSSGNPLDHTGQVNANLVALADLLAATGPQPSPSVSPTSLAAPATMVGDATTQALVLAESTHGLVPWCAMEVVRSVEAGDESSYAPPQPCGCAFENALGSSLSPLRCATCRSDGDCQLVTGAPFCSYGYCEATP